MVFLTASAVIYSKNKVLLIKRNNEPDKNKWARSNKNEVIEWKCSSSSEILEDAAFDHKDVLKKFFENEKKNN